MAPASMSHFATRRLIDAAAPLDPADRALLNLWVNWGLNDAAVARMTGMSVETIADRRAGIVERLSTELGLPPEDVRSALAEIVPSSEVRPHASADAPAPNVTPAVAEAMPAREPVPGSASRPRRRLRMAVPVGVIVAAVVLVASLVSGGSHHRGPGASSAKAVAPASSSPSPVPSPSPSPSPSPPVTPARGAPLTTLPGGLAHTTGTAVVVRKRSHLRLDLRVSYLPRLSHGHYEVWLYNSIVDSEPLGRLRASKRHASLRLPNNAGRYRWIDVSVQPHGHVFNSGDSVLRSTSPLFARTVARRH